MKVPYGKPDTFIGKVARTGNSLCVVIPNNNVTFSNLKEGDHIQVWYKKQRRKENGN